MTTKNLLPDIIHTTRAIMVTIVPCNLPLKMLHLLLVLQVTLGIEVADRKVHSTMNADMIRFPPLRLSISMAEEVQNLVGTLLQMVPVTKFRITPLDTDLPILPARSEIHLKRERLFPHGRLTTRCHSKAHPQRRQSDDQMTGSLVGYGLPPVPPTLVAGMDPGIAKEISDRIYHEKRASP